ncbi:haloacid dehalogenase type II [Aequorivita sp. CIP111184]|uniref:haloacid dehalogenase type II n=1 Tax=Aequorivita sp. CIP111184 TaxID=2211356 RepID=UPI000DBC391F|nr:haloacid dehalogenase type II [Aequorivita sp. CIP111184]SRX55870.1 (S)-2-haloacid dehalogenase [Aequorivita sp. CIP111184]
MTNNRRNFIKNIGLMGASGILMPSIALGNVETKEQTIYQNKVRPKILFFDVNETLLDLTNMKKQVGEALGGREDLLALWFTTMLQYSLVTTAGGQYEQFGNIGAAALQMVAANNGILISEEEARNTVLNALRDLPAHPEVKAALKQLKKDGYKLVSFTNSSNEGVKKQFESAGLTEYFDERLSVEDVGKFKPFADTYSWAARKMGVKPEECMLIAAHGWDVAGAMWAGWRAAFISRPGKQLFPLAPVPEFNEKDLMIISEKLIALRD